MKLTAQQSAALRWMVGRKDRGASAFHAKWTHRDGRKRDGAGRTLHALERKGLVAWVDDDARIGWVITDAGILAL